MHTSRSVSRVLYGGIAPAWRPFIWDAGYPAPLAVNPNGSPKTGPCRGEPRQRRSYSTLLPVGFAVPLPLPVARWALTPPFHPGPRKRGWFVFCGTFPEVALAGRYPAPCLRGARTFLDACAPRPPDRLVCDHMAASPRRVKSPPAARSRHLAGLRSDCAGSGWWSGRPPHPPWRAGNGAGRRGPRLRSHHHTGR